MTFNSDSPDSSQLSPLPSSSIDPLAQSTPVQDSLPSLTTSLSYETSINVPGLLEDTSQIPSSDSNSLQSWSDLDSFLPFAETPYRGNQHVQSPSVQSLNLTANSELPDQDKDPATPLSIPVVVNQFRQNVIKQPTRVPCRFTVRRDNRAVTGLSLPNIMVTNHRSIFPKFKNLIDEILENDMHLGLHSEVWENKTNNAHAHSIEEALEIHGIQYISTPRPNRRGGGAAITLISDSQYLLTKLDNATMSGDKSLEVCWGLLKLKKPTGQIKCVIVCSFYLPPNSRKKAALIEHISVNYFSLKSQYPQSAFVLGGDKNDLNTQHLLNIDPSFHQIVTKPTYKQAILDVLITDIGQYYLEPVIRPAVQPDNPGLASPSDHHIVFAKAYTCSHQPIKRETKSYTVRPLPTQALQDFAGWVQREPWTFVYDGEDTTDMVARFDSLITQNLNHYCPTKIVKVSNLDGKVSSIAVRQISRRKKREYSKNGNSQKYKALKKQLKSKLRDAAVAFLQKQVGLVSMKSSSWLRHVKKLTAKPGDTISDTFSLPKHVEENLSALESSNLICEYFSSISQEYSPLDIPSLPARVRAKLDHDPCSHPYLADHVVHDALLKGKKTCGVPGDLPIKVLTEFLPELTAPIAAIYREAISTHSWPSSWKKEFHLPIKKVPLPQSEDDLRNLGLTPFFSKRLEWFLIKWIWPYIEQHIDSDQLGGLPGCSINHYLIQMLNFIHKNLDEGSKNPTAVICGLVDFSKAFNRIDHNVIVTILSDLNIPTCALRLITSYLSNRKMCVKFNGATSLEQPIPGGGPQGGLLTVLLFDLQVNLAGAPCPIPRQLPLGVLGPEPEPQHHEVLPPCHQKPKILKKKYVDDLSMLEKIDLKSSLKLANPIIGPPNYHEIPGLFLPPNMSILQHQLEDLVTYTHKNGMKINMKKTKIMIFNFSKKFDFLPQLSFPGSDPLEVIYSTKLLGVTLTSNLSWAEHVNELSRQATKKLWILIRFKTLGGTTQQLVTVYQCRIRSTLEFGAPVFHSGLTKEQSRQLELVQKKATAIILGKEYINYESALNQLRLERLDTRRTNLCYNFALSCIKSPKHKSMFSLNPLPRQNMRRTKPYIEVACNTSRYYNSPVPYLTRLLNLRSDVTTPA